MYSTSLKKLTKFRRFAALVIRSFSAEYSKHIRRILEGHPQNRRRASAESSRASAESSRASAESSRASAESSRASAESSKGIRRIVKGIRRIVEGHPQNRRRASAESSKGICGMVEGHPQNRRRASAESSKGICGMVEGHLRNGRRASVGLRQRASPESSKMSTESRQRELLCCVPRMVEE